MAPGARSKFGAPMFEPDIFRKQMYCIEESICDIVGTLWRDSAPGELCPPFLPRHPPRGRGHFRYGVERAKCFVNVHWHCIVSNMERISKISSFPLEKFLRTPVFLT